jgi:hypothetical protein
MVNDVSVCFAAGNLKRSVAMRRILFVVALFALVAAPMASAADISGNWALKMQGPMGEEEIQLVIKAVGEKLKITGTHSMLEEMSGTGTLKGDSVKFKLEASGEMLMGFEFTGKVAGNKMSGTREMKMAGGPGGDMDLGGPGGGPMDMSGVSNKWTAEKQ